jgi:hypothetical protein
MNKQRGKNLVAKYVIREQLSGFFTITRRGSSRETTVRNRNGGAATFRSKKDAQDWILMHGKH